MTDPIADLLVRLSNAQGVRAETVDIPHSKIKEEIIKLLAAEGYLAKFESLKRMEKKFMPGISPILTRKNHSQVRNQTNSRLSERYRCWGDL
jgi:ribosomal protein S8